MPTGYRMARFFARNVALLAALAVLMCAATAFGADRIEHAQATRAGAHQLVAQRMMTSILAEDGSAEGYLATGRPALLTRFEGAAAGFSDALSSARGQSAGSGAVPAELATLAAEARRWQTQVAVRLRRRQAAGRPMTAGQTGFTLEAVRTDYSAYTVGLARVDQAAVTGAQWLAAGLVAAVAVLLAAAAVLLTRRAQLRERARTGRLSELRELLQVSGSEPESRRLLLRHVQRLLPPAGAVVLTHVESEDRLEATLGDRIADTPLRALAPARPGADSCLAIRLGRGQDHGGSAAAEPLVRCEICGRLPGDVVCEPLRVNGRSLGAVLVASDTRIVSDEREQLREAVVQSAPIFAIQRNLEATERRAASDPLTELPNRRAAADALRRLSAQAGRTVTPLAAVLVDLDHFKLVNDRFGHQHGDQALQGVARALLAGVRASDFVARYGGEEFLVLAPDTDRRGGADVAEKLRRAVEELSLPAVGRITASFGVAALPEDAVDPEQLLRRADRALYAAKALGRNRVQEAEPSIAPER